MWRAAWLLLLAACGSSAPDASRAPVAGTYTTVDSTCGDAPVTFELSANADGSISYAPCVQTTCTPDAAAMFDDGTGTFVGSGESMNCGTDPQCGCEVNDVIIEGDKAVVEADGTVVVSIGRASHRLYQCPGDLPPGIVLAWCDVHGVLQR